MTEREILCENTADEDMRACAIERRAAIRLANRFLEVPGEVALHAVVESPLFCVREEARVAARALLNTIAHERQEISAALPRIDNLLPDESPATISERFAAFMQHPSIYTLDLARTPDDQYNDWTAADRIKTELTLFSQELSTDPYQLRAPDVQHEWMTKDGIHVEVFNEEMIDLGLVYLWDNQRVAKIVDTSGEHVASLGKREEFSLSIPRCEPDVQTLIRQSIQQYHGRLVGDALHETRLLIAFQDEALRHKHTAVYCYRERLR